MMCMKHNNSINRNAILDNKVYMYLGLTNIIVCFYKPRTLILEVKELNY